MGESKFCVRADPSPLSHPTKEISSEVASWPSGSNSSPGCPRTMVGSAAENNKNNVTDDVNDSRRRLRICNHEPRFELVESPELGASEDRSRG